MYFKCFKPSKSSKRSIEMTTQIILDLALCFHTGICWIGSSSWTSAFPRSSSNSWPTVETACNDVNEEGGRAGPFSNARSLWTSPDTEEIFSVSNSSTLMIEIRFLISASGASFTCAVFVFFLSRFGRHGPWREARGEHAFCR